MRGGDYNGNLSPLLKTIRLLPSNLVVRLPWMVLTDLGRITSDVMLWEVSICVPALM
jgi:hypothetical protein